MSHLGEGLSARSRPNPGPTSPQRTATRSSFSERLRQLRGIARRDCCSIETRGKRSRFRSKRTDRSSAGRNLSSSLAVVDVPNQNNEQGALPDLERKLREVVLSIVHMIPRVQPYEVTD